MAEKDFREKRLAGFDDVFADLINGLIFRGDLALIAAIKHQMKTLGLDATKIMRSMGISENDQIRYAAKL